jgi:hypothetical protein
MTSSKAARLSVQRTSITTTHLTLTHFKIAEERERDAPRQRRHDERAAAALAAADKALAAQVEEKLRMLEAV